MKAVRITSKSNESKIKLNLDSGVEYRLWLEANVPLNPSSDCWIFLLLPACMKLNEDLKISDTMFRSIGLEKKPTLIELLQVKTLSNDFLFFKDSIGWAKRAGFPNSYQPLIAINIARLISRVYYRLNPDKKTKH